MGTPSSPQSVQLRDRFDRLFVQQLVARRFARDYPADFQRLRRTRDAIHAHILSTGINPLIGETASQTLMTLIGIYETTRGQQAIAAGNVESILANYPLAPSCGIRLEKNGFQDVIAEMAQHLDEIQEIQKAYNHFDYFTLADMTATFSSQSAFEFYIKAAAEDTPIYPAYLDIGEAPSANWFFSRTDPDDLDLAIALISSRHERMFSAPNVEILGNTRNSDPSNSKPGHNALYLKIDLDQAPYNIDYAIRAFRASLLDALLSRHGMAANIDRLDDFINSAFCQRGESANLFIQKWNQIQGTLIGIWCWDLVEARNIPFPKAADEILQSQAEIIAKSGDSKIDPNAIGDKAIEKHYYKVSKLLNHDKDNDELSRFVTGDKNIVLGKRP